MYTIAVPFTSHHKLSNYAEPKPFSSVKPACWLFICAGSHTEHHWRCSKNQSSCKNPPYETVLYARTLDGLRCTHYLHYQLLQSAFRGVDNCEMYLIGSLMPSGWKSPLPSLEVIACLTFIKPPPPSLEVIACLIFIKPTPSPTIVRHFKTWETTPRVT